MRLNTAPWLLKEEMRRTGSLLIEIARECAVPAGHALAVAKRLRTGTVNVNGGLLSAHASSGGWRASGIGRERGVEGLRVYQQIQGMNISGA